MTTQAIVFPQTRRSEVRTVEVPPMGKGDVLLEVEYSALSPGTERWCLTGGLVVPGEKPLAFPHVPGYQAAGRVRQVGAGVSSLAAGDRAFSRNCSAPAAWNGSWWGGHVGLHVAPEAAVIKLPDTVSTADAASLLVAQVGYNGATRPVVKPGDKAVVIGEGLVGLFAAQVLRNRGAHVIVSGLQGFRLGFAERFAADDVFDASRADLGAHLKDRFPKGVDVVVETASSAATVRLASTILRNGGQLVLNGFYPPPENLIDWHWLRGKEITVYCPNSRTRQRLEATLGLIASGVLRVGELVTHELSLTQSARAYQMLLDREAEFLGVNIRWPGGH